MTRQMPESVIHTSVSQFLTSALYCPVLLRLLEQTSELFLVWEQHFLSKTTTEAVKAELQ